MPKEKDFDQLGRALFLKQSEIGRLFELSEDDGDKHVVTYADLAALEEKQNNK